jgi:hypothetical protein
MASETVVDGFLDYASGRPPVLGKTLDDSDKLLHAVYLIS